MRFNAMVKAPPPTVETVVTFALGALGDGMFFRSFAAPAGIRYLKASTKGMTDDQRLEVVRELVSLGAMTVGDGARVLQALRVQ